MLFNANLDTAAVQELNNNPKPPVRVRLYTNTFAPTDPVTIDAFDEPSYDGYQAILIDGFGDTSGVIAGGATVDESRVMFERASAGVAETIKGVWMDYVRIDGTRVLLYAKDFDNAFTMEDARHVIVLGLTTGLSPVMNPAFQHATFSVDFDDYNFVRRGSGLSFVGTEKNLIKRTSYLLDKIKERDAALATRSTNSAQSPAEVFPAGVASISDAVDTVIARLQKMQRL